ncbi:hypothetical protein UCRPC4_g02766 [Phaeomoniella chlamydospora]|uniref:Uncharacterized protein n=1 Tax=Phaeomoniella chlamydospora TaxID=158046 RepID=A0A0G2GKD3_PHACM|nr:hypothetical protein UCRPC4_g02766 [Phaeomoniella chlamydospora]
MTSSSPNNLAGAYERPGNGEPHIDNHQDLPNRNTIHVSSHYPEARQASGSVTQKNPTESQSNLEGANTALNGNLRPLADTDHGVTVTTKNTPGGSNQDRQVSTPSAPIVEEPTMPHDWSATNSRLHTVTQGDNPASNAPPISIAGRETQVAQIESSLNKDQVQSIIDPSRELLKSYSPGPVSHQSHGPSSSNPMARKCSGCSKAILSASDFCTKCQNENQPAVPEVQAAIEPSDKPPVAEASLNGLRPELATRANDAAPENPGSVKRQRSSLDADGNGHIFVPKKARLEYKPPKDARPKIVTAKKSSSNSSRWTTSQEMEKMLERLAKEKDRVRTLTLELSELRKREEDARQQVIEKERAIKSAENGQVLRVSEVEELRIRHEADQKELARLRREINDSAKCKSGLEPLPEDTTSREPVETDRGALNNEDAALEEHMKVLKAHGVVFETDSESDDDYTLVPKPQPKPRPRDPLWHRATTSKCLFEVAPYHLPPAMSRDALEAKKVEIASRPRRKQTFGKVLGHTKFERGVDPHKEVERTKEPMNMIITQREQSDSGWGHGDGEGTYESNVSFNKLVGIFDDPIPFLIDGQLAFRSGNTQGRRAKLFFPVGA